MSKIPAINEIDANSPSQESTEVVVKATTVTPDINEIQETISASATIQEIDGTRKPTISEIYKIVNDGLFESTTNWWDYAYKLSQAQINQDIISRLDNGLIGGGYSKGVDIITTTSSKVPTNTNVYSALKSDSLYPKKLNDEVINGIYDFLNGITIGKPTAYAGGTWSVDKLGKTHLTTDYLYVRLKAIFETLQILNVDTIGGKLVISPAGSIRVAYVDKIKIDVPVFKHDEKTDVWSISQVEDAEGNLVNETLNQEVYRCYFLGEQDGEEIENKWKVGDQAQAKTFNVKKGTYHKVENSYLWRLVVNVSTDTVDIDGKKYHYVDLSQIDFDSGSDAPAPGDILNQLGHRLNDTQRQTALVLNAVDNYAPSITLYAGINYYTYLNKEYVEFGVYNGKAFFNVYGDMYIGDKGINPKTYIKYKNGKLNIRANLEIGSSIGDKDLDEYIKENSGVDEETVKKLINNSQVIKDLQKQTDGAIETWFYEGEPTLKNLPAIDWTTEDLKKIHIGDLYYDQTTGYAYRFTKYNDDVIPYRWNRIKDNDIVAALDAANRAQATADGKMKVFYGEIKPTNYQVGDIWVNATLAGKFNNDIARAIADNKTSFNADDWVLASRYSEAIATIQKWTNEYETKFSNLAEKVKQQKDQSIVVWYYDYEPTVDNIPANTWNTNDLRSEHIGDIFYDIKHNHSYRWTGSAWSMIKDADFDEAMKKAKDAEDLADKKRQIFYSDTNPIGGDRGDLWVKQIGNKTEVWVFDGTNWVKSNDKDLADYTKAINKELEGIKGQLDGKAETWYQPTDPSTNWTNKTSHEGDIWYNTTDGTTQYWNGTAWEKMDIPKDVFDTIDGKSSIFVDSYDDAKAGKGVISNGYNERDIWILPADAIVNGVQYYKGDILTATADGTVFNEKHWTKKVRYVGDKELTAAIDTVNKKIGDISATTLPGLNDKFNEFAKDGILDSSEKARLTDLLNQANNEVLAVNDQITSITKSDYLAEDNANKGKLIEAQKSLSTAWTEYKTLIDTLIASTSPITKNNIAEASTKYTNLQNYIKTVKQYLAACQADVLSNIGIDINSYKYLKEAFKGKTEVNGGLVVTNVLQLRQTSDANSPITAGISGLQGKANANGVVDKDTYDITSIAAWFGGPMVDKDIFTDEQLKNKVAGTDYARSLFRHDGSGYLASGSIHWGTDGILYGNPNSFILQGTSLGTYTRLFYLHYVTQNTTDFNNIDYITPKKTFSRLNLLSLGGTEMSDNLPTGLFIGDSKTGGSFQIGNIILRTKSGDPNVLEIVSADSKKTAHLGVQGGVSAYGTYTPSTGGGGGLNASVVSYANIIATNYNDADLTTIPNAYSVKALSNRIDNIVTELGGLNLSWNNITGKPTTFTPSAHKHKWIDITDRITKVSQLANDAGYLTTHQSLANYYTKAEIDEKGYTTNKGTVTSVGLTLPTGLTCATKSITTSGTFAVSFASGYSIPTTTKQSSWDSAVSAKHSHSNKSVLDGISSAKVTHWDSAYNWYSLMTTDEETADGIINKWNEVVNFLANIAQTDTLSGIINGINTSISNEVSRAKKAEGTNASNISANKTSITTLQGYFTNGSAKKALQFTTARKLWGNDFNGTTDINGSIIVPSGKYISIGNIKLEYDATNKALKITNTTTNDVANLYTSGGVSAYGVGTSSSSGGGLNGSVKAYADAIKLTSESLSEIASAYSIKALDSRISSLEGGSATAISVSGSGNAVTSVTKNGTTISVVKGSTFLTSHQTLDHIISTDERSTVLSPTSYLAGVYPVFMLNTTDGLLDGGKYHGVLHWRSYAPSANDLTGGYPIQIAYTANGRLWTRIAASRTTWDAWKKIARTEDIPTKLSQLTNDKDYLTSHQSLAGYATQDWVNAKGYITSSGSITGNAATATNADKLDGYHANGLLTALSNSDKGISITVGGTTKSVSNISVNYANSAGNADTVDGHHATDGRTFTNAINWSDNWNDSWSDGTNKHPWYGFDHRYPNTGAYSTTITDYFGMTIKTANTLRLDCKNLLINGTNISNLNVASATKLQTARTIWGQSFDGTGNVNGTIYINNNNSTNGAILLNNDKNSHARISAIDDKVIFNTSNAIRFGETDWDWNKWAGLKYNHSNKTIYLGIADGSVFHADSVQSNGTLNLPNITTITTNGTLRIGENLKGLYLGNSNNNSWVFVQDMCSQNGSGNWCIYQNGSAKFKNTTIDGTLNISSKTIINDSLDVKGLITNQGILPANSGFNNKGVNCIVSADALCSGLTAITDSIPVDKVTIQYSNNNGSSWDNLNITNDNKFKMYTNSAGINTVYLGNNFISGSTNAEKLAQVKKNELMFSFYFPDNCYSQIYFACVDISNGVNTTCTVEIVRENGEIADKYTKEMFGWNKFNYINFASTDGNDYLSAGTSYRRVVRFRFKHNQNITESRNACINKIRIFAFTKYSFPTDRFMGHTGHIYNFDYNMNTYFPNSVVAKGGVTAYQSSDIRLKTNINKLNCLNVIKSIGGTYEFDYIRDHKHSIGFIAQNINNPLLKDIVAKDDDGYLKINYWNPKLISLAFGALTQIDDEVNKLKARVTYLESEVERLNNENKLLISK
nr:MAG TPA: endosialidase chaperone [Crassvirales sp.]